MRSFMIIHQFLSGDKFKYAASDDSVDPSPPSWMSAVETILAPMPAASKRVFLKFFHHLPNIAGAAYTPAICAAGFSVPGIHKLNVKQIMSIWPGWGELGAGEQKITLEQITEMSILQGIEGTTTDALNQEFSGY
jgi:hypothetical protein